MCPGGTLPACPKRAQELGKSSTRTGHASSAMQVLVAWKQCHVASILDLFGESEREREISETAVESRSIMRT